MGDIVATALTGHVFTELAGLALDAGLVETLRGGPFTVFAPTDAAFAAVSTRAPVVEGFGVRGFGAHSTQAEYVHLDSIAPKMVLVARTLMTLGAQGVWVQWGVLLASLVAAVVVFLVSIHGRQLIAFGRDAWREVQKVVWPTRKESMQMTAYVFAFVVVMALFLWLTDKSLEWVLYDLILGWKK